MPDDRPISQLFEALEAELSQVRLEWLAKEFEALAQDRPQTLVFFVLQHVCQRLVSALEGEAVSIDRHRELTAGIGHQIEDILRDVQQGVLNTDKLERLVVSLYRNLGLYRA
jgi:hypothetical protein